MRRLLALVGALLAGRAEASVFDIVADSVMSQQAPKAPGDTAGEKPREVLLNGFPLHVLTGRTPQTVKEVLDYYQSRYRGGALADLLHKPFGVRNEGPTTGTLVTAEVPDKATAVRLMDEEAELPNAGPMRLVYARRGQGYTDYLLAWSDRTMPKTVMDAPQSGDAPGGDIPGVPRPLGFRTLTFAEPRAGYVLAMYQVDVPPDAALRQVEARFQGDGWQQDRGFQQAAQKRGKLLGRFTSGKRDVVVTVRRPRGEDQGAQVVYLSRDL